MRRYGVWLAAFLALALLVGGILAACGGGGGGGDVTGTPQSTGTVKIVGSE